MLTGLRVFVVEDEAILAIMIEESLEELGCHVAGVAAELHDAVEKARILALDVGMLDVNLAGQQSYPVAEILRARGIPFIFATGYGVAGLPPQLRDVPILAKPFRQSQLAAALSAVCCPRKD